MKKIYALIVFVIFLLMLASFSAGIKIGGEIKTFIFSVEKETCSGKTVTKINCNIIAFP